MKQASEFALLQMAQVVEQGSRNVNRGWVNSLEETGAPLPPDMLRARPVQYLLVKLSRAYAEILQKRAHEGVSKSTLDAMWRVKDVLLALFLGENKGLRVIMEELDCRDAIPMDIAKSDQCITVDPRSLLQLADTVACGIQQPLVWPIMGCTDDSLGMICNIRRKVDGEIPFEPLDDDPLLHVLDGNDHVRKVIDRLVANPYSFNNFRGARQSAIEW